MIRSILITILVFVAYTYADMTMILYNQAEKLH